MTDLVLVCIFRSRPQHLINLNIPGNRPEQPDELFDLLLYKTQSNLSVRRAHMI